MPPFWSPGPCLNKINPDQSFRDFNDDEHVADKNVMMSANRAKVIQTKGCLACPKKENAEVFASELEDFERSQWHRSQGTKRPSAIVLAAGSVAGLLLGGPRGGLVCAGGGGSKRHLRHRPTQKRIKFLVAWARLQLDGLDDEEVFHASCCHEDQGEITFRREVLYYVLAAAAPWAKCFDDGVDLLEATEFMHAIIQLLETPRIAAMLEQANKMSEEEWLSHDELPEHEMFLLERWHHEVLPTLVVLPRVKKQRSFHFRRRLQSLLHRSDPLQQLADWSKQFLANHPTRGIRRCRTSMVNLHDLWQNRVQQKGEPGGLPPLPPQGAEDEMSEINYDSENLSPDTPAPMPRVSENYNSEMDPAVPWQSDCIQGAAFHGWDALDGTDLLVRGPNFLKDGSRVTSAPAIFKALCVDLCCISEDAHVHDGTQRGAHSSLLPGSAVQKLRRAGERRFLFVINFSFAPQHMLCVFAADLWPPTQDGPPSFELMRRFIEEMDDTERRDRFKLMPRVLQGPWLLKNAVGNDCTTNLSKFLKIDFFHEPGDHFEVCIDAYSQPTAKWCTGLVLGGAAKEILQLATVLEGVKEEELPEHVHANICLRKFYMSRCRGPI